MFQPGDVWTAERAAETVRRLRELEFLIPDRLEARLVDDSVEEYAAAMQRLVSDSDLLDQLTQQAEQSRGGVTWPEVADQYAAIYAALHET